VRVVLFVKLSNGVSFSEALISKIKKHNGKVNFVQLSCNEKELSKRVKNISRRKHAKIREVNTLKKTLSKYDLLSPIPFVDSYTIDNTNLSANKTALKIKKHFKLK